MAHHAPTIYGLVREAIFNRNLRNALLRALVTKRFNLLIELGQVNFGV